MLFPSALFGQDITISNPLVIGANNKLTIQGFGKNDSLSIEAPFYIKSIRSGQESYNLLVTQPTEIVPVVLKNRKVILDTIMVSVERCTLKQYLTTNGYGQLISGEYPLAIIKSIESIELTTNFPGKEEIPVIGYAIEISNEKEVILYTIIKGETFKHPEVMNALKRLKKNGLVSIRKIHAVTPWDDGDRPQDFYLKAK